METVILLHGLARTSRSMGTIRKCLEGVDFTVINIGYPWQRMNIEAIAKDYLAPAVKGALSYSQKIHFVTHSMGGIILRHYLEHAAIDKLGRAVMLAPPNGGSELIDILKAREITQNILGPAACQLSTDSTSLVNNLGKTKVPTGVIIGSWSWNPFFSLFIPGLNDGKVSVESSKLPGMQEHLVAATSHSFIMYRRTIHKQVISFLRYGRFIRADVKPWQKTKCIQSIMSLYTSNKNSA